MAEKCITNCVYRGCGCLYDLFHGNPRAYVPEFVEIGQKCLHPYAKKIQGLEEKAEDSQTAGRIILAIPMSEINPPSLTSP